MLASHANAALDGGAGLRLPAHPAFMVVRRARFHDRGGDAGIDAWFDRVREVGAPLVLADAGVGGDTLLANATSGWRIAGNDGPLVIEAASPRQVTPVAVDAATAALRAAATGALDASGGGAPAGWSGSVVRALAILDSAGSGEELSDVAWPHFLLPSIFPLPRRRLAAAAATLWLWEGPGSWTGPAADLAHAGLREPVSAALTAAVAG